MYLSELDRAFENKKNFFYLRYQDDIIVLCKSKRQLHYLKRRLKQLFTQLKLRYARNKTKIGPLNRGFHMLGIDFKVNIEPRSKKAMIQKVKTGESQNHPSKNHLQIQLHERSCFRAHEKVTLKKADAGTPDEVQRYLFMWSRWWARVATPISSTDCITRWIARVSHLQPELAWIGSGLLHYLLHPKPALGRVLLINT